MQPDLRAAIVQDAASGDVLMLAWMDDEALRRTRESGEAHFWSRSRGRSGGRARPRATRSRSRSCGRTATATRCCSASGPQGRVSHRRRVLLCAVALAHGRRASARLRPDGSYVASLLERGTAACAQKLGEEGVEVAVAGVSEDDERLVAEIADLWFHSYVLLAARGLDPAAVERELRRRAAS